VDGSDLNDVFVRAQVKKIAPYFNKVYVISPISIFRFFKEYKKYRYGRRKECNNIIIFYPLYLNFPFPIIRNLTFIRELWIKNYLKAILKVIRKNNLKFDIIHAHFTWPSGYAGMLLKNKFKVPLVITTHALHSERLKKMDFNTKEKYTNVWKSADAIINVSHKCVNILKKLGIPSNRIYYVQNGVDLKKFKPMNKKECRKKLGIPLDKKIIVGVGNLVEKKGFIYLIRAVNIIKEKNKNIKVYIVGKGPLHTQLKKEINKFSIQKYVHLVGPKPHSEIPLWINAADVFVLPSLIENFGIVNIEALACGKPVVSTYNGGSGEIITSEEYGFICPLKNPECLAEKILISLNKRWDKKRIVKYSKRFSWEVVVKEILDIYNKILRKWF